MVSTWKTKKGKTSKFVDAGGYNRYEREELITWNGSTEKGGEKKKERKKRNKKKKKEKKL